MEYIHVLSGLTAEQRLEALNSLKKWYLEEEQKIVKTGAAALLTWIHAFNRFMSAKQYIRFETGRVHASRGPDLQLDQAKKQLDGSVNDIILAFRNDRKLSGQYPPGWPHLDLSKFMGHVLGILLKRLQSTDDSQARERWVSAMAEASEAMKMVAKQCIDAKNIMDNEYGDLKRRIRALSGDLTSRKTDELSVFATRLLELIDTDFLRKDIDRRQRGLVRHQLQPPTLWAGAVTFHRLRRITDALPRSWTSNRRITLIEAEKEFQAFKALYEQVAPRFDWGAFHLELWVLTLEHLLSIEEKALVFKDGGVHDGFAQDKAYSVNRDASTLVAELEKRSTPEENGRHRYELPRWPQPNLKELKRLIAAMRLTAIEEVDHEFMYEIKLEGSVEIGKAREIIVELCLKMKRILDVNLRSLTESANRWLNHLPGSLQPKFSVEVNELMTTFDEDFRCEFLEEQFERIKLKHPKLHLQYLTISEEVSEQLSVVSDATRELQYVRPTNVGGTIS